MTSSDTPGVSSVSETPISGRKRKRDNIPAPKLAKARKHTSDTHNETLAHSSSSESDSDSDKTNGDTLEEAQVLSHAAQRKLRNKEKKLAKEGQPLSESPVVSDAIPKRQNSVWVGNLAFKTTEQSLRAFFTRGVPDCEMTRIHLPTKTGKEVGGGKGMRGENRGFAYVDFRTKEDKEQAIALSEHNLDGRKLLIKDGSDFSGRPTPAASSNSEAAGTPANSAVGKSKTAQRILAAQKQSPGPTLFLGNLGFQATEESISNMFTAHMNSLRQPGQKADLNDDNEGKEEVKSIDGKKLRKVRMGTFEDSGLCKGWAFVDFFNTEDSTAALLDTRNHHLDGRKLVVEYASAEAVRRGGGPGPRVQRDKPRTSDDKKKTARTRNGIQVETKAEDRAQGEPTTEDVEHQDQPPKKKAKTLSEKEQAHGGKGKRTRPGAALALAKREKVAIVPSSGKKTIF